MRNNIASDDDIAGALRISPMFGPPRPLSWSIGRLVEMGRLQLEEGLPLDDMKDTMRTEYDRGRVKVMLPVTAGAAAFESSAPLQMRDTDDVEKRTMQLDYARKSFRRRRRIIDFLAAGPGLHAHITVAAAMVSAPGHLNDVIEWDGNRVERCGNCYRTARIQLGAGATFGQADEKTWVEVRGRMPETLTLAMVGRNIRDVVEHPWLVHDDLMIQSVERKPSSTRIVMDFAWTHIPTT